MMKVNKWTMGLAGVGLISIPAIGSAEEQMNQVWTALSSTTLSGYVNTSMHWNPGSDNAIVPGYSFNSPDKQDGFNLNVVKLALEKPLDEAQWAAGYKVELLFGQDAGLLATGASDDIAIKQAYVNLRTPVGNGLDFKVGVWDTVIGYEVFDSGSNPNYTRSYGYTLEPTTHTGVLGSYQLCAFASVGFGIANTTGPTINEKAWPTRAESYKSYLGSLQLTAPDDWGFLAGSTLYGGFVNGYNSGANWDQTSLYVGLMLNTPVKGWRVGMSYDYLGTTDEDNLDGNSNYANALAFYTSFSLTEKLSLHGRADYVWTDNSGDLTDVDNVGLIGTQPVGGVLRGNQEVFALTGTLQYELWKNVLSRLEVRWDHQAGDGDMVGYGDGSDRNSVLVAANFIYNF